MSPLEELIPEDPAWPLVQAWIAGTSTDAVALPVNRRRGEDVLRRLEVTPHSTLGAVALETGGILIDHGWLRLLGSGSARLRSTLATWNTIGDPPEIEPLERALIVAHDAVGGFFALNAGEFSGRQGHVFYFPPDTLEWESLERGYTDFVHWALTGDLGDFYADIRWAGWQEELGDACADLGFALYPPPFTVEGRQTSRASRTLVPMRELWAVQQDHARRLAG